LIIKYYHLNTTKRGCVGETTKTYLRYWREKIKLSMNKTNQHS